MKNNYFLCNKSTVIFGRLLPNLVLLHKLADFPGVSEIVAKFHFQTTFDYLSRTCQNRSVTTGRAVQPLNQLFLASVISSFVRFNNRAIVLWNYRGYEKMTPSRHVFVTIVKIKKSTGPPRPNCALPRRQMKLSIMHYQ